MCVRVMVGPMLAKDHVPVAGFELQVGQAAAHVKGIINDKARVSFVSNFLFMLKLLFGVRQVAKL
jgi:hypothetical protein